MKRDPHPRVSGRATPACSCDHNKRQVRRDSEPIDTRDGIPLMGFNPFKKKEKMNTLNISKKGYGQYGSNNMPGYVFDPPAYTAGNKYNPFTNGVKGNPLPASLKDVDPFATAKKVKDINPFSTNPFENGRSNPLPKSLQNVDPFNAPPKYSTQPPPRYSEVSGPLGRRASTISSRSSGVSKKGYVKTSGLPMVREPVTGRPLPPTAKTSSKFNWSGGLGSLATLGAGLAINQLYREYAPKSTGMDILSTAAYAAGPVPGILFSGLGALVGAATQGPALTTCEEALQMQKGSAKYDSDLDPDIWLARTHPDAYRETQANGVPGMPTYVPGKSVQEIIKSRYYQEFCDYVKSKVAASPEKQTQQPAQQAVEDNEIATCQYMTQAEVEAALKAQQAIQVGPSPQGRIGPK